MPKTLSGQVKENNIASFHDNFLRDSDLLLSRDARYVVTELTSQVWEYLGLGWQLLNILLRSWMTNRFWPTGRPFNLAWEVEIAERATLTEREAAPLLKYTRLSLAECQLKVLKEDQSFSWNNWILFCMTIHSLAPQLTSQVCLFSTHLNKLNNFQWNITEVNHVLLVLVWYAIRQGIQIILRWNYTNLSLHL